MDGGKCRSRRSSYLPTVMDGGSADHAGVVICRIVGDPPLVGNCQP